MDDVWSEQNPGGYFPRLRPIQSYNGGPLGQNNDRYLQSVAYLRFKNLTIGYTLPVLKKYLSKLRIYVQGTNLFTWTDYSGYNPEVNKRSTDALRPGEDYCSYPLSRTFSVGVNFNL